MKCVRCHQDNPSHAKFCLKCGTPFAPTTRYMANARADEAAMHPKVILPRRVKADVVDGLIAGVIMMVPVFTVAAVGNVLPPALQPLSMVGFPGSVLYMVIRDSLGKGTSLGKRWLGLLVIDLATGMPCPARRVWARNILDPIPILDLIDFVLMCVDSRGQKIMDKVLKIQVTETS